MHAITSFGGKVPCTLARSTCNDACSIFIGKCYRRKRCARRAQRYIDKQLISKDMADKVILAIEQERNHTAILNEEAGDEAQAESSHLATRLSADEMKELLTKREGMMLEGDGETDQWRVYKYIVGCIERGELLRLFVQASAGTGYIIIIVVCVVALSY